MQLATIGGTMAYSDDLIHFAERDPPRRSEKADERKTMQQQVEEFLANGGQIQQLGNESAIHYPIRRDRKAQVNFMRSRGWQQRENKK